MYYPFQIPNVLNKTFQEKVTYTEYHHDKLQNCIMCLWSMQSKQDIQEPIYNTILPDGCVDLIVDFTEKKIVFSAFSKATKKLALSGNIDFLGIRLKPGAFYHIYDIDSSLVMDTSISYEKIETKYNLENIFTLSLQKEKIDFLFNYLIYKTSHYLPNMYENLIDTMYLSLNENCISQIAKNFSYSIRQLNRIFYQHYGLNPKTLLNILRLHQSLSILLSKDLITLTSLAINSGFCDQSHFIKEIKKYCGISPTELLEQYQS